MRATAPAMKARDVWDVQTSEIVSPGSIGLDIGKLGVAIASDVLLLSSDVEVSHNVASLVKKKEFQVFSPGVYRVSYEAKGSEVAADMYVQSYINGALAGVQHPNVPTDWTPYTDDLAIDADDLVQLYLDGANGKIIYGRYFRISGDVTSKVGRENAV